MRGEDGTCLVGWFSSVGKGDFAAVAGSFAHCCVFVCLCVYDASSSNRLFYSGDSARFDSVVMIAMRFRTGKEYVISVTFDNCFSILGFYDIYILLFSLSVTWR